MSIKIEDGGTTTKLTILSGGVLYQTSLKVDTVADLKTTEGVTDGQVIELLGRDSIGDGGGGMLYWDASSTEADDDGTVFQATGVTTGRWKRSINDKVYATYWDYVNDPVGAINSALSTSKSNVVVIPDTGGISVSGQIVGQSNKTVISYEEITSTNILAVDIDSKTNFEWRGGSFIGDGLTNGQECFVINDSDNCSIKFCDIDDFLNKGVSIAGNSEYNYIYKVDVDGATGPTGVGVSAFSVTANHNKFESCVCNNNRIGLSMNGGKFNTIINCTGNDNSLMGITFDGVVTASGDGCKYSTIMNCVANGNQSSTYAGIYIGNGSNYNTISGCVAEQNVGGGVRFTESTNNILTDCPSLRANSVSGVMVNLDSSDNIIANCNSYENTQRGAIVLGLRTKIVNCNMSDNTDHGILIQSDYCIVDGNTVSNNGDRGIYNTTGGNSGTDNIFINNDVRGNAGINLDTLQAFIKNNKGWVTANKGQQTMSGTATIDVTHGLDVRPRAEDIVVTPLGDLDAAGVSTYWITNQNDAFFQIKVNTGVLSDIDWAWKVDLENYVPY